jgi:hypothetical protein
MKVVCEECGTQDIDIAIIRSLKSAGLAPECPFCKRPVVPYYAKRGFTDNRRRSKKQENRVAAREGGRRQPGSGAVPGFEGDVRKVGKYRGECKFTRASSYRLKLEDLKKLENQASGSELPVFDIEFQSESPAKRYVVLPEWVYETLMVESRRRDSTP